MRSMLRYLVTGSALLSFAALGCGEQGEGATADPIERPVVAESPFKPAGLEDTLDVLAGEIDRAEAAQLRFGIALVSDSEPWNAVRGGAERAFEELGARGVVTAPSEAEQADFVEREREEASSGIGLTPLGSALEVEVERARNSGIPVVTIEHDLPAERDLFVGFGQDEIGQRLGDAVLLTTTRRDGRVVILGADDETLSPAAYLRSTAAKRLLEETGFEVTILNSSTAADGEERDVEMLEGELLADPRPQAVLGVLETSYRVALAAAAAERSLAAEAGEEVEPGLVRLTNVDLVAYGLEPATVEALRGGILSATLAERRHYMGYLIPYVLAGFNLLGVERTKYILTPHLLDDGTLDVGMDLILPEELDTYFEFQELLTR